MLDRCIRAGKLCGWGVITGATLVALFIAQRSPNSIWTGAPKAPSLQSKIRSEVAMLRSIGWEPNGATTCQRQETPTSAPCPQQGGYANTSSESDFPVSPDDSYKGNDTNALPSMTYQASGNSELCSHPRIACRETENNCRAQATECTQHDMTSDFVAGPPSFDNEACKEHYADCQNSSPQSPAKLAVSSTQCRLHKLEPAESVEIMNRKVTMRDSTTNETVATLTIAGPIATTVLPEKEIELAKFERSQNKAKRSQKLAPAKRNFLDAYRDEVTGHFTLEAQTIEIGELANQLGMRFGMPIVCHDSAIGTVSATVSDVTLLRAVRRLVEPFGYAVVEYGPQIVIGELNALEYAARMEAVAQEAEILAKQQEARRAAELAAAESMPVNEDPPLAVQAHRLPAVSPGSSLHPDMDRFSNANGPSESEIQIGLQARDLVAEGRIDEVIDFLTNAIQQHTESAILFRMLAEAYLHQGESEAAEAAAKRSLAIDRNNALSNRVYSEILAKMGQKNRSEHYLRQAQFLGSR